MTSKPKVMSHLPDLRFSVCVETANKKKGREVHYMGAKHIVKNISAVFLSLLDSQLSNSIDLKKEFPFVSSAQTMKKCVADRERLGSCMQDNQIKFKMRCIFLFVFLRCPSHVHLCGFLLFVS